MNRQSGRKKSNFVAVESVPAGAFQDIFYNGVNRKISYTNYLGGLGVTGTIVQDGAVSGVAVLDTQGTVNNIRNLEAGQGINLSVSAENGITVAHGFTQSVNGSPIVVGLSNNSPEFVGIVAGTGVNISYSAENASITINATGLSTPSTIVVASLTDFPSPVGGVITLESGKRYEIADNINLGVNRLVLGHLTEVVGAGSYVTVLTYTGTGALFTWVDATISIDNLGVSAASGSVFDGSCPTTPRASILENIIINSCSSIGSISDASVIFVNEVGTGSVTTDGFAFGGNINTLHITDSFLSIDAGTLFDLGSAVFESVTIDRNVCYLNNPGIELISGLASSGNLASGATGSVLTNRVVGDSPVLTGITADDVRWQFAFNDGIRDTHSDGTVYMQGNSTATTIGAITTPVLVAGTWTVGDTSRFTGTTSGRLTFTGQKPERLPIDASVSLTVSGSNQKVSIYLAKNGTVIDATRMEVNAGADVLPLSTCWQEMFENGDYIELFVRNATTTGSVTVTRAVIRIN